MEENKADDGHGGEGQGDHGRRGLTRRDLIKRVAIVGGAAVWAAPVIRMAIGGGDPETVDIGGSQLAAFTGQCSAVELDTLATIRTVCATDANAAKQVFKDLTKSECANKCSTRGPCTSPKTCKTPTDDGTSYTRVDCVGPGLACPPGPYGSMTTYNFVCASTVTCNCACL